MANPGPDTSHDALKVVEQTYSAALDPLAYDVFIEAWTEFVEKISRIERNAEPDSPESALIESHFHRGLDLLERFGRARKAELSAEAIVASSPSAALLSDKSGKIISYNELAEKYFGASIGLNLSETALDENLLQEISEWALNTSERYLLLQYQMEDGAKFNLLAARTTLSDIDHGSGNSHREYIILSSTHIELSDAANDAIADAFRLSKTETEVANFLVQGFAPTAIAEQRHASIHTVRTQIKSILKKVEAKNASDLVRILCGFAVNLSHGRTSLRYSQSKNNAIIHRIQLPEGRQVVVTEQGAKDGRPVLFFHSMLSGVRLPPAAIETCARKGWRIIAPSRPGYGLSDTNANHSKAELVDQTVKDFAAVVDHFQIDSVVALGHLQGSIYAQRFAMKFPEITRGLVFVSHAPYWSNDLLKKLPRRQRIIAQTTRYAPKALRFVTRAGVALIDSGRHDRFLNALHRDSPADMRALRRPDVYETAREGLEHTIRNGSEAFCLDCPIVLQDWSSDGCDVQAPISILLGEEDQVATKDYADGYASRVEDVSIHVVKGAGHYLLFTHWPQVLRHISEVWQ